MELVPLDHGVDTLFIEAHLTVVVIMIVKGMVVAIAIIDHRLV
jgi:hypothetical protein